MSEPTYILSYSYGKDSTAAIHVIKDILHWPLDRIITSDIWFDDDTPADLPEVWEFKKHMDEVIKERWGIEVEHVCATVSLDKKYGVFAKPCEGADKLSCTDIFYWRHIRGKAKGEICGFPMQRGSWCKYIKYAENEKDLYRCVLPSAGREVKDSDEKESGGG